MPLDYELELWTDADVSDLHQVYIENNFWFIHRHVTDCVASFGVVDNHLLSVVMVQF